ncbi:hypothetical protein TNCV_952261 [Trichonephila clavipes]|nr:hypothetical protein TNCV_952261 [Trichonephila clavipes]
MGHLDPIVITSTKSAIQRFLEWEKLFQSSFRFADLKMAGRSMRKLTVIEALKYMRQLSENESENDNDDEIVYSDDEYVPSDEKNIPSDETISNFPV